jgi:hypothetical protein
MEAPIVEPTTWHVAGDADGEGVAEGVNEGEGELEIIDGEMLGVGVRVVEMLGVGLDEERQPLKVVAPVPCI